VAVNLTGTVTRFFTYIFVVTVIENPPP